MSVLKHPHSIFAALLALWAPFVWSLGMSGGGEQDYYDLTERHYFTNYLIIPMLIVWLGALPSSLAMFVIWARIRGRPSAQIYFFLATLLTLGVSVLSVSAVGTLSRPRYFFLFDYVHVSAGGVRTAVVVLGLVMSALSLFMWVQLLVLHFRTARTD